MKKAICVVFALLLVVVMPVSAFAAQPPTTSTMDVTTVIKVGAPQKAEDYTIQVVPLSDSNPMPVVSDGGVYDGGAYKFTITGADTKSFSITFDQVGNYQYLVSQVKGSNKKCTYDDTEYLVTFQVRNTMMNGTIDGNANFTIIAIAQPVLSGSVTEDGVNLELGSKCDIVFTNKYWVPPANVPSTGDESNVVLYALVSVLALATLTTGVVVLKRKKQ